MKAFSPEIIKLTLNKNINDDLRVELIGILGNIQLGDQWIIHLKTPVFMVFLQQNLSIGDVEDDILLETIVLIANICDAENCLEFIASSDYYPNDKFLSLYSRYTYYKCIM